MFMAQSVRIKKNAKNLHISKAEVNLSQTRPPCSNLYGRLSYLAPSVPLGFNPSSRRGPSSNNNGVFTTILWRVVDPPMVMVALVAQHLEVVPMILEVVGTIPRDKSHNANYVTRWVIL
uniref:Uncharacterized protein n=1 Tax=Cannabis sativa TaxID=3483 RepID=A0A803NW47_CANSA